MPYIEDTHATGIKYAKVNNDGLTSQYLAEYSTYRFKYDVGLETYLKSSLWALWDHAW